MSVDLQQLLRLEVERDPEPGELLNLAPNPSGELGAWGWETPVPGANLGSFRFGQWFLIYTSPGSVPSHFYTTPVAVDAGQYAAARITATSVTGQFKISIEWLDADHDVIGTSTQSVAYGGSTTPRVYGSYLAPSGTLWCRLRIDHYNGSGGNPAAGAQLAFRDVVLTAADTAGQITWNRVNLIPTPTGDGTTGGWTSGNGSVGTSSAVTLDGSDSLTLTKTPGDGTTAALVSPSIGVTPGRDYAIQAQSRAAATTRKATVAVRWYDADGKEIRTREVATKTEPSGDWTGVIGGVATAPTNAATARMRVTYPKLADSEVHYVNAVMLEQASTVGPWFDGDSADTSLVTYSWDGTAHASTSTAAGAIGDPGELVPVPYQNILGPSRQITVDREDLNIGSMEVKLFDAVLDPSQSDLVRPGRRIRLVATTPDDGPQVLFAGKIFTGSVTYHLLHPDAAKRAEVTLTAVDPINPLASTPQREGVATIHDLPHVLEPAGVPWNVNGSGNQVADPDVAAYNDNATVLDQVAVTRDSALGYAWVDRNGVLQAWDRDEIDDTIVAELDESTYTADLDIDFDLDTLINSVTVRVLRVIATTGATEEVVFGPYVDVDSYRQYGEHAKEFVVQGFDATDTASIQAYAQQILDASATPALRVKSLVLPLAGPATAEADVPLDRALLDLYDRVTVTNDRADLTDDSRITSIHHEISATVNGGRWLMTLGFVADGSVAPATAVPAPPPGVGQVKDDIDGSLGTIDEQLEELNTVTLPALNASLASLSGLFPITSTSISDGAISTPKLAANAVTADKILANAVGADKIAANSIGADHIVANAITAGKIAAGAITADKLSATAVDGKTITGATISGGAVNVPGVFSVNSGGLIINAGSALISGTNLVVTSNLSLSGGAVLSAPSISTGGVSARGAMIDSSRAGTFADASINTNGRAVRTTSTERVKKDITPIDFDEATVLAMQEVTHRYIDEETYGDGWFIGLIAEQLIACGMGEFVFYDQDGLPEGIHYPKLIVPLLNVVRKHRTELDSLTARVEALEA